MLDNVYIIVYNVNLDLPVKTDIDSIEKISTAIKSFNTKENYTNMYRFFDKLLELKLISNYDNLELNT